MRIAIIGAGKMGAWFASVLADGNEIAVYDTDRAKAEAAASRGAKALPSLDALAQYRPQMLLNAVSLQNTVAAFESAAPHIGNDCILADIASVKGALPDYYQKAGRRFASTHPMFGPTFGDMAALREENAVVIKGSDAEGAAVFRSVYEKLGLHIFDYTFDEHDRMMAYSLTTPFAASLVFAACMENSAVPGTTFARHRKLARGLLSEDDHLLAEILFNTYSLAQLEKITSRLEFLKHVIRGKDYEEAKRFFDKLRRNVG
ncbi:prephenate dehydrogenase/arogenate dehydrogenase family protein [Candidatus Micrarchaeota archaeon]|nr:prephenate dehydrogenase/arogenate dehydrogenase family protein [Candidatus Micrarchaeota archaeon]